MPVEWALPRDARLVKFHDDDEIRPEDKAPAHRHRDKAKLAASQARYYRKKKARILARNKKWRERNADYHRQWRKNNPDYNRLYKADRRAKKRAAGSPIKRVNNLPKQPAVHHLWRNDGQFFEKPRLARAA